ncbi:MAG: hypothetical protein HC884_18590 [Chloroflexaceae bacterium]|nr:hypothetical protein [Chloroflexaceae bacterium]
MTNYYHAAVMHMLNEQREELIPRVARNLVARIPIIGVPPSSEDRELIHHHQMALTARRFHDLVQAGATIDWSLVSSEFGWADRKLRPMGITHEHHRALIAAYFIEARLLHPWTPNELAALEEIAALLRQAVEAGYQMHDA